MNSGLISGSSSLSESVLSFIQTRLRAYFLRIERYIQADPIKYGLKLVSIHG